MGIVLFGPALALEAGNVSTHKHTNFYTNEAYLLFYIVINFFFFSVTGFPMPYSILIVAVASVIYTSIVRYIIFCSTDKIFQQQESLKLLLITTL